MFELRKSSILRKIFAHFDIDASKTSQKSWDKITKGFKKTAF